MSGLRFLADESCDFALVRALRGEGHDVLAVMEVCRGVEGEQVVGLARREGKVILTEDRDFGRLAYASGPQPPGVVYLRFPATARGDLCAAVSRAIRL